MSQQGQEVQELVLASATAATSGAARNFQLGPKAGGVVVVQSTGALASFTVEGRITPLGPWVSLHGAANVTLAGGAGSALQAIASAMTEMRLTWTGNAALVSAWAQA